MRVAKNQDGYEPDEKLPRSIIEAGVRALGGAQVPEWDHPEWLVQRVFEAMAKASEPVHP